MADTFPRQYARTRRFTLGAPRSFQISPDGATVAFLRSRHGADPVTCLWALDVASGTERVVADPAQIGDGGTGLDPRERARRERSREQAAGIVGFATDRDFTTAVFALSGRVYLADLTGRAAGPARIRALDVAEPAADPRLDPAGHLVGYVCAGALRVIDTRTGTDRVVADPGAADGVTFGLAEFIAAEEIHRTRGYWWAPDSTRLLVARVDENPVLRWYIADPAHPAAPAAEVRYPAAGSANATVELFLVRPDGTATTPTAPMIRVGWDQAAFPYLVTACWDDAAPGQPLIVVQSRDQRRMRVLAVDTGSGATTIVRDDSGAPWLEIVPGVPAWTDGGSIVWTADDDTTRRLLVASPQHLADGSAPPVTPAGLQVREVLDVDGDTVLFTASDGEPTEIGLWTYGPGGVARANGDGRPRVEGGRRAGGTTVAAARSLSADDLTVQVLRDGAVTAGIGSQAERPLLPSPAPEIFSAGAHEIRTALLLPSWHRPGSGPLPVLMAPYGGPHGQQVLASRSIFLTAQWFAEQGFAVVVADGRGTPGRGPAWAHAVAGDLAGPPLADQVTALHAAAERCADLDLGRVAIRGWSFGGFLAALAVLRRPEVFHAAVAGAPVTAWRLYDTHYTERYLGHPDEQPDNYERSSLLADAAGLRRPLLIVHGLADDNVVVAHSLRLSSALLAAGRPHSLLPLSGVTHLASQEEVAENLLLLQLSFLRQALGMPGMTQARAADLGLVIGTLPAGRHNAITDVPGVLVGHTTIVAGADIRTGVTAIVPPRRTGGPTLPAGLFVGNGYGKMVGVTQVSELGEIETPIVLTNTLATFLAADALISYLHALPGNEELGSVNPVVAETNDGFLSDLRRRPVTGQHVLAALRGATGGPVAEGAVGAGTGTGALGYKAGIGTASRVLSRDGRTITLGALVQANFSGTLTVAGVPVPARPTLRAAGLIPPGDAGQQPEPEGNSCVIVLATDAPLDARQLGRVARRAVFAMARAGSNFDGHSGDYALAFSTAAGPAGLLPESGLDQLFVAALDSTEEAILNSLLMAETTAGFRQHVRHAVPLPAVRAAVAAATAARRGLAREPTGCSESHTH